MLCCLLLACIFPDQAQGQDFVEFDKDTGIGNAFGGSNCSPLYFQGGTFSDKSSDSKNSATRWTSLVVEFKSGMSKQGTPNVLCCLAVNKVCNSNNKNESSVSGTTYTFPYSRNHANNMHIMCESSCWIISAKPSYGVTLTGTYTRTTTTSNPNDVDGNPVADTVTTETKTDTVTQTINGGTVSTPTVNTAGTGVTAFATPQLLRAKNDLVLRFPIQFTWVLTAVADKQLLEFTIPDQEYSYSTQSNNGGLPADLTPWAADKTKATFELCNSSSDNACTSKTLVIDTVTSTQVDCSSGASGKGCIKYTFAFHGSTEFTPALTNQFRVTLKDYEAQSTTEPITGFSLKAKGYHLNDMCGSGSSGQCWWLQSWTKSVTWPTPTLLVPITVTATVDLSSQQVDGPVSYKITTTYPNAFYKTAQIQVTVTNGSTKTLNGNKDVVGLTNYDVSNFDNPTTTAGKNVFIKIANDKSQPAGAQTFVAHFFNNPAAAGPEIITIKVLSVTGALFEVYEGTATAVQFVNDLTTKYVFEGITQSNSGIPTSITLTHNLMFATVATDLLTYHVYMPTSNYQYMKDTTNWSSATNWPQQADYDAMTYTAKVAGVAIPAPTGTVAINTQKSILELDILLGTNVGAKAAGTKIEVTIHGFFMPGSNEPILHTGNLMKATLVNRVTTRCPTSYSKAEKDAHCIHDDIHSDLTDHLTTLSSGYSFGSAYLLTKQHDVTDREEAIFRLTFHVLNPFPTKDTYLAVKGVGLILDSYTDVTVRCVSTDICQDAWSTAVAPNPRIDTVTTYLNKQFGIYDFWKSSVNYLERGTKIEFDVKGFKKLNPSFDAFISFHVETRRYIDMTNHWLIDDYMDFSAPIKKRQGDMRAYTETDSLSSTYSKKLGNTALSSTLYIELDIETFQVEGSKLTLHIPKSNIKYQPLMGAVAEQEFLKQSTLSLTAATWGGVDILASKILSSSLTKNADDWTNDLFDIQLKADQSLAFADTEIDTVKILKLTFANYVIPQSTEPIGACTEVSQVAGDSSNAVYGLVEPCFAAKFTFDFTVNAVTTPHDSSPFWISSKGFTYPEALLSSHADNLGAITVGQGDIGIEQAQYSFTTFFTRPFPADAWVDVQIPIGFGTKEYLPSDKTLFLQCVSNKDSTTLQNLGSSVVVSGDAVSTDWLSSYQGSSFNYQKGYARITHMMKEDPLTYNQYISPAKIAAASAGEAVYQNGQVGFELTNFINTLEMPSVNWFFINLGYSRTVDGVSVDYGIESIKVAINMEQPQFAKMILTPMTATDTVDRVVGSSVKLRFEYNIQKSLKRNSVFEIQIPKDLTYYQDDGISPQSAVTTTDTVPFGLNRDAYGLGGTQAVNTIKVQASGWLMWQQVVADGDGLESNVGTPTDITYKCFAADGVTEIATCAQSDRGWYIYLGEAFDNDRLVFDYRNAEFFEPTKIENGDTYRIMMRVEISNVRNPPSLRSIQDQWKASIRVPAESKAYELTTAVLLSTEAVTPFTFSEGALTGLYATSPGLKASDAAVEVLLEIGQNKVSYAGAQYKFKFKLTNPLPKRSYVTITANFDMWADQTVPESNYLKKIITCVQGCLPVVFLPPEATQESVGSLRTIRVPIQYFETTNLYRDTWVEIRISGLKTPATLDFEADFTIDTWFEFDKDPKVVYQIDSYKGLKITLKQPAKYFNVNSLATIVGQSGQMVIKYELEENMTIYQGESYMTIKMPKANFFYKTELDQLKFQCLGDVTEDICCDTTACLATQCCPFGKTCTGTTLTCSDGTTACVASFYQKSFVDDFSTVTILQTKTKIIMTVKWVHNTLETTGEVKAEIPVADMPELVDTGNGCWNKPDIYRFKFNIDTSTSIIPAGANCTMTISTLRNPLLQAKLYGTIGGVDLSTYWSLEIQQMVEGVFLTNFEAKGPASKDSVPVDLSSPLEVLTQGQALGSFEKTPDLTVGGGESYKFKLVIQNNLYGNSDLTIKIPTSTSWSAPAAGEVFMRCSLGCRPNQIEWTMPSTALDTNQFVIDDLSTSNSEIYKEVVPQNVGVTFDALDGVKTIDASAQKLQVWREFSPARWKQYQTLVIRGLFNYAPGSNFLQDMTRATEDQPGNKIEISIDGFTRPTQEACEDFYIHTAVNLDAGIQASRIELYREVIFTYTSQDLLDNLASSIPSEEDCVLGAVEPNGEALTIRPSTESADVTPYTSTLLNRKFQQQLWKFSGKCREELRYNVFAQKADGQQLPSQYISFTQGGYNGDGASIELRPAELNEEDRYVPHAIYIQGYDMSVETATNWLCFMARPAGDASDFCQKFCAIDRADRNPVDEANILLDANKCTASEFTGTKYSYQTNNPRACPLVQVMTGREGMLENFSDGQFLIRPTSQKLTDLGKDFFVKTTITGCSSGNSQQYNLYFYLEQCRQQQITPALETQTLSFFFDSAAQTVEDQDFLQANIGFANPEPDKCPLSFYFADKITDVTATPPYYVDTNHNYTQTDLALLKTEKSTIPIYADSTMAVKLFEVTASFTSNFITIQTIVPTATAAAGLFSDNELKFTITVQAFSVDASGKPVFKNSMPIIIQIAKCNSQCVKCDQASFDSKFLKLSGTLVTDLDRASFWANSQKCGLCADPSTTDASVRSQQIAEMGVDEKGAPIINRMCLTTAEETTLNISGKNGKSSGWGQIHTFMNDQLQQKACSDVIYKCSSCATALKCLQCDDTKTLRTNQFKTKRGEDYLFCTNQINYKLTNANGEINSVSADKCSTSIADSCKYCMDAGDELCLRCRQPYFTDGTKCKDIVKDVAVKPTTTYFLKSNDGDTSVPDVNVDITTFEFVSTPEKTLSHLQQVFYLVTQDAYRLTKYYNDAMDPFEVTVYLGPGTHFFYTCNCVTSEGQSTCDEPYCSSKLASVYQTVDNVIFHFKPLRQADFPDTAAQQAYYTEKGETYSALASSLAFSSLMVPDADKVTIAVMDNQSNFNITRGATFEDIIFRGDYGMLSADTITERKVKSPVKHCVMDETQNLLKYGKLQLTAQGTDACEHIYFEEAVVPSERAENIVECDFESAIGSVRKCSGEPYSDDYDTIFTGGRVRYKRRKVLFNLYNFDLDISRYNTAAEKPVVALTLKNCEFKYFLSDYEALIYAETSIVESVSTQFSEPYIVQLGDDRGMRLTIENSSFKHSSFCKGMIVFREQPELLPLDNHYLVFNFKYEAENQLGNWEKLSEVTNYGTDKTKWPFINIQNSEFTNLNVGKYIDTISVVEGPLAKTTTSIKSMPDNLNAKKYPYFDNHGAVLNVENFPGKITMTKNQVHNNMYFVPEVYPAYRDPKETPLVLSGFDSANSDQIHTKVCVGKNSRRFFGNYLASIFEQDSKELSKLEKHSAIYIGKPQWPISMISNSFKGNVGMFGGAISINEPQFKNSTEYRNRLQQADLISQNGTNYRDMTGMESWNNVDNQPVMLMKQNTFENNQAYLSGNAVYIRFTRQHYQQSLIDDNDMLKGNLFENREKDHACGGGLLIVDNSFKDNSPVQHASHGGAISIECDFLEPQVEVSREATKYKQYTSEINILDVSPAEVYNSMSSVDHEWNNIRNDLKFDQLIIKSNVFDGNEIGQKGAAIYARQASNLQIVLNKINRSQPAYSFRPEAQTYPYFELLSQGIRPTLFQQPLFYADVYNELDFLQINEYEASLNEASGFGAQKEENRTLIDLPQVQGAIFVETCPERCYISFAVPNEGCSFCNLLSQSGVQILNNTFEDNQDGFAFWEQMSFTRASCIYSRGTHNITINYNKYYHNKNIYDVIAPQKLTYFAHWLPDDYFQHLQAPLIRIYMGKDIETLANIKLIKIEGNEFVGNHQVQPWIEKQHFKGSLFQIEAEEGNTEVEFNENKFDDNYVRGGEAALISINGPLVRAANNIFYRSGVLDNIIRTQKADPTMPRVFIFDYTKWESYAWEQKRGIFWLEGKKYLIEDLTKPLMYKFEHNVFNYTFANFGAVYSQDVIRGQQPTYIHFNNNTYNHAYALDAAIMKAEISGTDSLQTYSIYNHTDEKLYDIQNGAYYYNGENRMLLYFYRTVVKDSFGVYISESTTNCLFDIQKSYNFVMIDSEISYTTSEEYWGVKPLKFNRFFESYSRERSKPSGYLNVDSQTFAGDLNEMGVIKLIDVQPTPDVDWLNDTMIEVEGTFATQHVKLWDMLDDSLTLLDASISMRRMNLLKKFMNMNITTVTSFIYKSEFKGICGADVSTLYVSNSDLQIHSSVFEDCYAEPDAALGSTVLLTSLASALVNNTEFTRNLGKQGGAIYAKDSSKLAIYNSTFLDNEVELQGGALMIEAQGTVGSVYIQDSRFYGLHSNSTAGAIAVNDGNKSSVVVFRTTFANNTADLALIQLTSAQMIIQDCFFFDNMANQVTNGIQASESIVRVNNTKIDNCLRRDCEKDKKTSRRLSAYNTMTQIRNLQDDAGGVGNQASILSGFFYMSAGSSLDINDTILKRLTGKIGSAIMLMTGSSLNITGGTDFKQMQVSDDTSTQAAVIEARNCDEINISDSRFIYNDAHDLLVQSTKVKVANTNFIGNTFEQQQYSKDKNSPFILALAADIELTDSTKFYYSQGSGTRGVVCRDCPLIKIHNNVRFRYMESERSPESPGAAALTLINSNAEIYDNVRFEDLQAYQGPAIYNENSNLNITGAYFNRTTQAFPFKYSEDWANNNFLDYISGLPADQQKALQPLLSVIWMNCENDQVYTKENPPPAELEDQPYCTMEQPKDEFSEDADGGLNVDKKESKGWEAPPKPLPKIPEFLNDYSFEFFDANDTIFRAATEEDINDGTNLWKDRLSYVVESQSGVSLNGVLQLLRKAKEGESETDADLFFDGDTNQTDGMIAIIRYISEEGSLKDQRSNEGDYISYSKNHTLDFTNNYFRLKPGSVAYAEIRFDWQVQARTDNTTSVYATGDWVPCPTNQNETEETEFALKNEKGIDCYGERPVRTSELFYNQTQYRVIKFNSTACKKGKFYYDNLDQTCQLCPDGTKTSKFNAQNCEICQENANCQDGNTIPDKGYVRPHENSFMILRCFNREACSGEVDYDAQQRLCTEGYTNDMCATCQSSQEADVKQYWKNQNTFNCYECSEQDPFYTQLSKLLSAIAFMLVVYIAMKMFVRSFSDNNVEVIGMIRILTMAFQLLFITSKMQQYEALNGVGNKLQRFVDVMSTYVSPAVWLTDFQCVKYGAIIPEEDAGQARVRQDKQLQLIIIPLVIIPMAILMLIGSGCSRVCTKNWTKVDSMRSINRIYSMIAIVTYFLLPDIVMNLLATTSCFDSIASEEVEDRTPNEPFDETVRRMAIIPDEYCGGEFYMEMMMFYVIPGLLIYGILLPFLILWRASKKSQQIFNSGSGQSRSSEDDISSALEEESVKYKFGFLFSGFTIAKKRPLTPFKHRPIKVAKEIEMYEGGLADMQKKTKKGKSNTTTKQQNQDVETVIGPLAQQSKPKMQGPQRGKCGSFVHNYLYEPIAGDGCSIVDETGQYEKRTFFYWEFILFWQKIILMLTVYQVERPMLQAAAVLFILITFVLMQLRNSVYKSARLARLHIFTYMMVIFFVVSKILIYGLSEWTKAMSQATSSRIPLSYQELSRAFKPYKQVEIADPEIDQPVYDSVEERDQSIMQGTYIMMGIMGAYALYFLWNFYVLFLVWLVESKSYNWFRVLTLCRWDLRSFVRSNILRDAHMTGSKNAAFGNEADIYPDMEFHIREDPMLDNSSAALLNDSDKMQPLQRKKDSDSATGSDKSRNGPSEDITPNEFEDYDAQKKRRKPVISDQIEGVRGADYDPARRTSVASASNVVLQNVDGMDLGPEADDDEKGRVIKQVESAKKRRQKERDSASDASKMTKHRRLLVIEEKESFESQSNDSDPERLSQGSPQKKRPGSSAVKIGRLSQRERQYLEDGDVDNKIDTARSRSAREMKRQRSYRLESKNRSQSASSHAVSDSDDSARPAKHVLKVEDEPAKIVVTGNVALDRKAMMKQMELEMKQKKKAEEKEFDDIKKLPKDSNSTSNRVKQSKPLQSIKDHHSDDTPESEKDSEDSLSDGYSGPSKATAKNRVKKIRDGKKPNKAQEGKRENIFHNQDQMLKDEQADDSHQSSGDEAKVIHEKRKNLVEQMSKAGDKRLNIFVKKPKAVVESDEEDEKVVEQPDDMVSVLQKRKKFMKQNFAEADDDDDIIVKPVKQAEALLQSQVSQPAKLGGGSGSSVPAAESSSQGAIGDSEEKNQESKALKLAKDTKPKAAPKANGFNLNIFKKTNQKKPVDSDEEEKEAQKDE